ncbi:hypothetical protein [Tannerella forsythia]|uniref:hypothetical protein n=1 Tax=Tannerella forsythia TaxID=28112 RepID=UPI000618C85B|nr:hypothetical protein [Tannerella forsythia]BAR48501.1 hypothetical protein TF3313_0947 [Tannerella forsythia 3313]
MKKEVLIIVLGTVCCFAGATDRLRPADTRTAGMGGQGVTLSSLLNPSLPAMMPKREVRTDYLNRYNIKELGTLSGGLCYPNTLLPFGAHVASFGYDEYRESMFRFSVARRLSRFWSLGVSLQYVLLQSELFERDVARIAVDVGAAFHPSDDWLIALSVINFPSVSIGERETNGKNPTMRRVLLGMNYWVAEKVLFLVGMETCKEVPFSFSAGMEYEAFTDFRIRSGISTHPFLPSAGVSYTLVGLTADVAFWYHPALGAGSGFGLSFSF